MSKIKFGICDWSLAQKGIELCKIANECGLTGVQIGMGPEAAKGRGLANSAMVRQYIQGVREYELDITSVSVTALDRYGIVSDDKKQRTVARDIISLAIAVGAEVGAPFIMVPTFENSAIRSEKKFEETVEELQRICDEAKLYGLGVCVENTLSALQLIKMLQMVRHSNIYYYYDSQNHYLQDSTANMAELFTQLCQYVRELHVKDGVDKSLSGALLGQGTTGFFNTAKAIVMSGYSGYIVSENYYHLPPLSEQGDAIMLLKQDVATMKSAFIG